MKIKTSELNGAALAWAVDKVEYRLMLRNGEGVKSWVLNRHAEARPEDVGCYCTQWEWGGPIIERERILFHGTPYGFEAWVPDVTAGVEGPTHLIAAMRAHVTARLGEEVDIPATLL